MTIVNSAVLRFLCSPGHPSPPSVARTRGVVVGKGSPAMEWAHDTLLTAISTCDFEPLDFPKYWRFKVS